MKLENFPKVSEMSDALVAKGIIADTFDLAPGRRSIVIGLCIAALKRVERALPDNVLRERKRSWTERRVRSIIDEEARRIDAYEIEDLKTVALAEARRDYRNSVQRAARMAALLAAQDEAYHGPAIAFHEAMARGVAGTGTGMAGDGAGSPGSIADRRGEQPRGLDRSGDRE